MATLSIQMNIAAASRAHAKGSVRQVLGQEFSAIMKVAALDDGSRLHVSWLQVVRRGWLGVMCLEEVCCVNHRFFFPGPRLLL